VQEDIEAVFCFVVAELFERHGLCHCELEEGNRGAGCRADLKGFGTRRDLDYLCKWSQTISHTKDL
jgi:hypothetical protein